MKVKNLNIIDTISLPGSTDITNQDYLDVRNNCILLLDGATPLLNKDAYPVEQFVSDFSRKFIQNYDNNTDVIKLASQVCDEIVDTKNIAAESFPSASAIILTVDEHKVLVTQIGDCKAYIDDGTQIREIFSKTKIEQLDSIALNLMTSYQKIGFSAQHSREMVNPILLAHRQLKNADEGYPSISVGLSNATHLINQVEIDLSDFNEISLLLASDGFYNGFENYQPHTLQSIFLRELTLKDALSNYRIIENSDNNLTKYPRFKLSDDATAILLSIR